MRYQLTKLAEALKKVKLKATKKRPDDSSNFRIAIPKYDCGGNNWGMVLSRRKKLDICNF